MEIHLAQAQVNQICQAIWAIAHALELVGSSLVIAAIIRGIMNK